MSQEIELKFLVSPETANSLREELFADCPASKVYSAYYDSSDFRLHSDGMQLRVRRENGSYVQTIKSASNASPFERDEIETPLSSDKPDVSQLIELRGALSFRPESTNLVCVFTTEFERFKRLVGPPPPGHPKTEVCLDLGSIRTGDRQLIVREVELELKRGSLSDLYRYALQLLDRFELMISLDSKADRGYRLHSQQVAKWWKPKKSGLSNTIALKDAITLSLRAAYVHFLNNVTPFLEAGAPESIHQMRVGLRRLRSILYAFKPVLDLDGAKSLIADVKGVFGRLGEVREIDVFLADVMPETGNLLTETQTETLTHTLERERHKLYNEQKVFVQSKEFTAFVLNLGLWIEEQTWCQVDNPETDGWYQRPLVDFARMRLRSLHNKLLKRANTKKEGDFADWHDLRILTKKLRYSSEFFSNLFDKKATRTYIKELSGWQDRLGRLNDLAASAEFVAGFCPITPKGKRAEMKEISLIFHGWSYAVTQVEQKQLSALWAKFEKTEPYWAGDQKQRVKNKG